MFRMFRNKKTLTNHKNWKHGPGGTGVACPIYGQLFTEQRTMKKHEKVHITKGISRLCSVQIHTIIINHTGSYY